jgi:hypothetical protein
LIWKATATLRLSFRWWNKGSAGPARSSPQPPRQRRWPAGPGLRAPIRSIIIVPGMRVLRAGRGRLGQVHGSTRLPTARREPAVRSPGHEPRSHPATRSAASPHIRSGVGHPHHNPSCTRARGSGRAGSFSETGILQPWGPTTTAPAEPARYRFADGLSVEVQLFKAAPSGTMPCVANRHSAIRSFRATATIAIRRMRPRRVPTNAANQRLIADPGW